MNAMVTETIYKQEELEHGICSSCNQESDEILKEDGRCIDCIEADKFYDMTMNQDESCDYWK